MKRDEKIKKKAKEKAAKESEEELYDEVFDEEYYGHLHDDAYMSADASEKVQLCRIFLTVQTFVSCLLKLY